MAKPKTLEEFKQRLGGKGASLIDESVKFRETLKQPQHTDQDKGFLGNLLFDLTSPLRTVGEGIRTATVNLSDPREAEKYQAGVGSLLSSKERGVISEDPLRATVGETLKAGSWAIPVAPAIKGVGVVGRAALGAGIGGAMYGAGAGLGEEDPTLGGVLSSTLTSGLAGAATGGALKYMGGKLAKPTTAGVKSITKKTASTLDDIAKSSINLSDDIGKYKKLSTKFNLRDALKTNAGKKMWKSFDLAETDGAIVSKYLELSGMGQETNRLASRSINLAKKQLTNRADEVLASIKGEQTGAVERAIGEFKDFLVERGYITKRASRYRGLGEMIKTPAKKSKLTGFAQEIAKKKTKKLSKKEVFQGLSDQVMTSLGEAIDNIKANPTASGLHNARKSMDRLARSTALSTDEAVAAADTVYRAFRRILDRALKEIPEVAQTSYPSIQRVQSAMYNVSDAVTTKAAKGQRLPIPFLNQVDFSQVTEPIETGVVRGLSGISNIPQNVSKLAGQAGIGDMASNVAGYVGVGAPVGGLMNMGGFQGTEATEELQPQEMIGGVGQPIGYSFANTYGIAQNTSEQQERASQAALTLYSMGVDTSEIDWLLKNAGLSESGGEKLSTAEQKEFAEHQTAINKIQSVIQDIEKYSDRFGVIQGSVAGDIYSKLGAGDSIRAGIDSKLKELTQAILKSYQGARPSDRDVKVFEQITPNLGDPPNNAHAKATRLLEALILDYDNMAKTYLSNGYDVSNL